MTMLIGMSYFLSTAGWHHVCVLRGNRGGGLGRLGTVIAGAIFNGRYTSSSISTSGTTDSLHSGSSINVATR